MGKQTPESKRFATKAWEERKKSDARLHLLRAQFRRARDVLDTASDLAMSQHRDERISALPHISRALGPFVRAADELTRD